MDPQNYRLKNYDQIPVLAMAEVEELAKTKRVLIHNNLVLDLSNFDHPGCNDIIERFVGQDATQAYFSKDHSWNSNLIVCHKTIGKLQNSKKEQEGRIFYNGIKDSEKNKSHQQILSKFDFSKPLWESFRDLHMGELFLLTEIPKFFKHPEEVVIAPFSSKLDRWLGKEHISFCSYVYSIYFLILVLYLIYNFTAYQILMRSPILIIGFLSWSIMEYMVHTYDFHHDMFKTKQFKGSDIHHCFPTLKDTISISVRSVTPKILTAAFILYFTLDHAQFIIFLLGITFGLLLYNFVHYNIHFGPEYNIGWLKKLRIHHLNHHFKNQRIKFGLTTTLWDYVYGTMNEKKVEEIKVNKTE